jgi:hypothetical protein
MSGPGLRFRVDAVGGQRRGGGGSSGESRWAGSWPPRIEWLDPPAEWPEHFADCAIHVALVPGLSQYERLLAVPAPHGVDQFLRSLPAERDALAILAPLVVGQCAVELEAELLVADAVLQPL